MNTRMVFFILGYVLRIEGVLMLLPSLAGWIYGEKQGLVFLILAVTLFILGFILSFKKPNDTTFYLKEGCVITALSWLVMSFFGALPFYISGEIPSMLDAFFETARTTGRNPKLSLRKTEGFDG